MGSENELTESQLGAVEELRSRFFLACEDTTFASEFDERDLERLGYDDWWVYNFFLVGKSKIDTALQKITNSFRWRKEFGVNDITEESFSAEAHEKGAAYPHGKDKEGRTILWFDVKLHNKKIPGQTEKAKRYLVYWLEKLQREYPSEKITVLEDMSGAGVSNMDLEVVKFKIRCFEEYFPFLVDMLFIYEMAWILNAIWKIVEKLLSEEAKSHIKFIRKGDIKTYIEASTLPAHMGGTDTFKWEYKPRSKEFDEFQSILYTEDLQELTDRKDDTLTNGQHPAGTSTNGMNSNNSPSHKKQSTNIKKSNLESPTGDASVRKDNCEIQSSTANRMQNKQSTATGDSSSSRLTNANSIVDDNFQVATPLESDLLTRRVKQARPKNGIIQERPKKVQFAESETEEVTRKKLNEQNKGLRLLRRLKSKDAHVGPLITISPGEQLEFSLNLSKNEEPSLELCARISLQNTRDHTVAFKVKTTSPDRYKVKPSAGPIKPNASVNINVYISTIHKEAISNDKFLVMSTELHEVIRVPAEMTEFWKKVSKEKIMEHRLTCAYVPAEEEKEKIPQDPSIALNKRILQLNEKITTLTELTTEQHSALQQKFNRILILLILISLLMMYFILTVPGNSSEAVSHSCPSQHQVYTDTNSNS
ncbi:motile sperm domain-containing protein 2-like [Antedon mediterranea]|uniref:motile sperm domain-containing protein 2-like n=1 Tax=Antedon mediterranea TaxID=105859 RepID=UPI003AF735AB